MVGTTRRYICWYATKAGTEDEMVAQLQALYPNTDVNAVEDHTADPLIPTGQVRVTYLNVTGTQHREFLSNSGVVSFD